MDKTYLIGTAGVLSALTFDDWIAIGGLLVGFGMLVVRILEFMRDRKKTKR